MVWGKFGGVQGGLTALRHFLAAGGAGGGRGIGAESGVTARWGTAGVGQEMHGRVNPKYFHLSVPGVSDTATVRKFCAFPSLISPDSANTLKEQSAGAGLALGARQSHISH